MALCLLTVFVSAASAFCPPGMKCGTGQPYNPTGVSTPAKLVYAAGSSDAQAYGETYPSPYCSTFTIDSGTALVNGGTVGFASGTSSGAASTYAETDSSIDAVFAHN